MGRHRRVTPAAAPAPVSARGHRGSRRKSVIVPVRTGLMGASAAMAMGAVAVASGLIPGPDALGPGLGTGDRLRADGPDLGAGVIPSTSATEPAGHMDRGVSGASRDERRADSPSPTPSDGTGRDGSGSGPAGTSGGQSGGHDHRPGADEPSGPDRTGDARGDEPTPKPTGPSPGGDAGTPSEPEAEAAAEDEVLTLVNKERKKAGCRAVSADNDLAGLAEDFSEDMAERDFFSHIDPDGRNPWIRAGKQDIPDLGGENIARGQADARSVMDTWMHSPGHKANILNCDYRTMGVGTHFADGGPWWTQDFGF